MRKRLTGIFLLLAMLVLPASAETEQQPYSTEPISALWNTYAPELHYYYAQLSEAEKRLFSARYDALATGEGALWNYQIGEYGTLERARVNMVLCNDCPELMFYGTELGGSYSLVQKPGDAYLAANPEKIAMYNEACASAAGQLDGEAASGYETQLAIDEYIKRSCTYDNGASWYGSEEGHTAYSSLVKGGANCVGYTMGAMYLLRMSGIPCLAVYGYVGAAPTGSNGHMWLMVEINGRWYHYDPTWDDWDSADMKEDFYPYLNLSTEEIKKARSWDEAETHYRFVFPEALSMEDNYYALNGRTLGKAWKTSMYTLVKGARASGKSAVGLRFADWEDYREFLKNVSDGSCYPLNLLSFNVHFVTEDGSKFVYLWW